MSENESHAPLWTRDESLRPLQERLADRRALPRLFSFDFFDTLVARLCAEPADLFVEVGRQLARRGLLRMPLAPQEFRAARRAADRRARDKVARTGACPEVELADIYAELREVVRDAEAARKVEYALERASCFVNPAIVSLVESVRALGCKTVILSDTYFSAAELRRILLDCGVAAELFDAILVSCEQGAAKWYAGSIYPELLRRFELRAEEVLHIGDDPGSDVQMALRHGIEVLHYPRKAPATGAIFAGEQRLAPTSAPAAGSLESLRRLVARRAESDDDPYRDGALTLGPLLARFADFAVARYREAGVGRVLALMREGEVLGELLRRAAAAARIEIEVVPCYVSRMATGRAALTRIDAGSAAELLEGSSRMTPQAILEVLGVGEEAYRFPPLLTPEQGATLLPTSAAIASFLDSVFAMPRLAKAIEERHAESRRLSHDYLRACIGDASSIGVLDLGWSASIQRNIARILRSEGTPVRSVGCYLACTPRAGRLALDGDLAHAYLPEEWQRNAILLEVAITACVGSTNGYARGPSGSVDPVLGRDDTTPEQKAAKARIRAGLLDFQELWLEVAQRPREEPLSSDVLADIDRLAPAILTRLLEYPTKPEAERLGRLAHDENYFGTNYSAPLCDEESAKTLRAEGAQALFVEGSCVWPHGVLARAHPRAMAVLRQGFLDPLALGRLGAWHAAAPFDAGITDEELAALSELLLAMAPEQIVFCGPLVPVSLDVLGNLLSALAERPGGKTVQPRLVVAGPNPYYGLAGPDAVQAVGAFHDPATLRAIREKLVPGASVALVVTSDVPLDETDVLLRALAPFLGPRGAIFTPCGRYDRHALAVESPRAAAVGKWLAKHGESLAFALWQGAPTVRRHLVDWVVLARGVTETLWSRQWMAKVSEFLYEPEPAQAEAVLTDAAAP